MTRSAPEWIRSQPIAHRGLHNAARGIMENSLSAFEAAAANNYAIELDVLPSKDGEAIVFHDEDLARLCGRTERVRDLASSALRSIRLGGSSETIPMLGDVMASVAGRVPLLIEIKSDGVVGILERRVGELIKTYKGPVAVQSFNPLSMAWFARHMPEVPRGQLSMRYTPRDAQGGFRRFALTNLLYSAISKPDFIAYEFAAIDTPAPRLARRLGLPLITWTVRKREDWDRMRDRADNLIFEGFSA